MNHINIIEGVILRKMVRNDRIIRHKLREAAIYINPRVINLLVIAYLAYEQFELNALPRILAFNKLG